MEGGEKKFFFCISNNNLRRHVLIKIAKSDIDDKVFALENFKVIALPRIFYSLVPLLLELVIIDYAKLRKTAL